MIMSPNPGIVPNEKKSLGDPVEKQIFTNAAVHPAVTGIWEET